MNGDKHVRLVIEFDIDQEALDEKGISAKDILDNIHFYDDSVSDGFRISTNIPGFNPTENFFLCEGTIVSKAFIRGRSRGDELDDWREMIREELDINGTLVHGFTEGEVYDLMSSDEFIDHFAEQMQRYIEDYDITEYAALDRIFEEDINKMRAMLSELSQENIQPEREPAGKASLDEQINKASVRQSSSPTGKQKGISGPEI